MKKNSWIKIARISKYVLLDFVNMAQRDIFEDLKWKLLNPCK